MDSQPMERLAGNYSVAPLAEGKGHPSKIRNWKNHFPPKDGPCLFFATQVRRNLNSRLHISFYCMQVQIYGNLSINFRRTDVKSLTLSSAQQHTSSRMSLEFGAGQRTARISTCSRRNRRWCLTTSTTPPSGSAVRKIGRRISSRKKTWTTGM